MDNSNSNSNNTFLLLDCLLSRLRFEWIRERMRVPLVSVECHLVVRVSTFGRSHTHTHTREQEEEGTRIRRAKLNSNLISTNFDQIRDREDKWHDRANFFHLLFGQPCSKDTPSSILLAEKPALWAPGEPFYCKLIESFALSNETKKSLSLSLTRSICSSLSTKLN